MTNYRSQPLDLSTCITLATEMLMNHPLRDGKILDKCHVTMYNSHSRLLA